MQPKWRNWYTLRFIFIQLVFGPIQNRQVARRGQQIKDRESKPYAEVFYAAREPLSNLRTPAGGIP